MTEDSNQSITNIYRLRSGDPSGVPVEENVKNSRETHTAEHTMSNQGRTSLVMDDIDRQSFKSLTS